MHSNISECDTELQIPSKKIKLSTAPENSKTREIILSKVLQKEIQQEINLRKEDLELIEGNIYLVRQKLTRLKQVLAAEYYRQKSVKGCLQFPHHPAVKDTFVGKSPAGYENHRPINFISEEPDTSESYSKVKREFEATEEAVYNSSSYVPSPDIKKFLEDDKLPCYIPPKNTEDNVVKPTEPRGIDSKKEIRIIVGNVSKWLSPLESSDATHKWTVYAKLAQSDLDISTFVKKVVFFLHKSYRPNDIIEIKYPPFKLTRRGWGEFPLKAQFHFKSPDNPPIDVMHHLKLDHIHTGFETFGAETSLNVWVHYPVQNGTLEDIKKQTGNKIIKSEGAINEHQFSNKLNSYQQQNILENTDAISDISLNANIDSFEKDLHSGSFSFPEQSCDSESISSLFEEIKHEELQSFSSLLKSFEDKVHSNNDTDRGNDWKGTNITSGKNEIVQNTNINGTLVPNRNFPEFKSEDKEVIEVKEEIEDKFSSTPNFQDINSTYKNFPEFKPKIEETFSEININEFEREGLFVDECAVVAEEVVIEGDDCELDNSNKCEVEENKNASMPRPIGDPTDLNHVSSPLFNLMASNSSISSGLSRFDPLKKNENNNTSKTESSFDKIVQQLGIEADAGRNKSIHKTETDKHEELTKSLQVSSILQDQKLNKIVPKNSVELINGLTLNNIRKSQKNIEKKSMIITLQKENGQIILRKEAKVQKFKDSSPKKGAVIAIDKKNLLINNKSLVNSSPNIVKQGRIIVDVKKQLPLKLLPNQSPNTDKNVPSASKCTVADAVQKKSNPGFSVLKKVKHMNKDDRYEDLSLHDLAQQCPNQNTEIAVNWLMKKFPLVDPRSINASFHTRHPYCAKDRDTFLNWPFAKQRAAEWMRAKAIGRILNEIPDLQKWTTLEILDWARVRCYTPIKNIPEYVGPTVEPSLNFVYRPRIDGIVEFLNQEKILTEREPVDIISDSPTIGEVSSSGNVEIAGTSQEVFNKNSILVPLDKEITGFTSFMNRCMTNSVGEKPSPEELLPDVHYPAVERILVSVFSSIAEELIRRSYNASWIRHCDNPPPEISIADVKAAILSRKEFDFLLPFSPSDNKGEQQPSVMSYFRK